MSFFKNNKVALAVAAVAGVGTIAGVLYYLNQKDNIIDSSEANKKKKKKNKKKKKSADSALDSATPVVVSAEDPSTAIYPINPETQLPEVTEESVQKLSEDEKLKWAMALKEKGNEYFKAKNYEKAIQYYSMALICKKDHIFYGNRSACYSALGDDEKTIEDTTKALEIMPSYSKCLLRRAHAYENLERYEESMFDLTALTIYGGMSDSSNETMLERVLKKHASKINEEFYSNLPKELPSSSSLSSFFGAFVKEDIDLNPEDYPEGSGSRYLVEGLNQLYLDSNEGYENADTLINQAVSQFEKSSEGVDPKLVSMAYEYSGALYFLKTETEKAKEMIQKALEIYPRPKSHVILGLIGADKGDYLSPDIEFTKAIKLNPEDQNIYYHYGQIYYLLGDLSKAQSNFEKAKKLNPQNVYTHIQLACIVYRQGDLAKCDALFKEAKSLFPTSPEVPNYYGEILFDRQEIDNASKQFDIAARLQESLPTFNIGALPLINKSVIYQRQGDIENCIKILTKACDLDPKSEVARMNLGQMFLAKQDVDDAIKMFEQACKLARSVDDRTQAISLLEASKMQLKVRNDPVLNAKVTELMRSAGYR